MGNDGGSIPTRRELVKEAARNPSAAELKESQQEQQEYLWTTDPISQKPLAAPVVSECTGKLDNKDTILEYLVEGARKEDAERVTRGMIKSLKDIVEVKFASSTAGEADAKTPIASSCPVTGDRLGPGSKAVYLVPCGHVFSGAAIKEVSGEKCLVCETTYASNDVIPILSTIETEVARLLLRTKTLQDAGLTHSLKRASRAAKKRKKREEGVTVAEDGQKQNGASTPDAGKRDGKPVEAALSSAINNSSTASLTAKVLEEGEAAKKRRRENNNVRSLFSNKDQTNLLGNNADFMTRGFSVPGTTKR